MKNLFILFFLYILTMTSCVQDDEMIQEPFSPGYLQVQTADSRSIDLEDYSSGMKHLWQKAIDDYGFEVICSCENESFGIVEPLLEDNFHEAFYYLFPDTLSDFTVDFELDTTNGYSDLFYYFKPDCVIDDLEDGVQHAHDLIISSNIFTLDEETLLNDLLMEIVENGAFEDPSYYRNQWNSINDQTSSELFVSAVIIETALAAEDFIKHSGNDFPNLDDDVQGIGWHIVGAIGGAITSVGGAIHIAAAHDVIHEGGDGFDLSATEVLGSALWGALTGVVMTV